MPDLFGDGFAVQFVVDFPDLGHSERRDGQSVQTEGHLLFWQQCHWRSRCYLCLWVFTWGKKHTKKKRYKEGKNESERQRGCIETQGETSEQSQRVKIVKKQLENRLIKPNNILALAANNYPTLKMKSVGPLTGNVDGLEAAHIVGSQFKDGGNTSGRQNLL